MGKKFRRPLVVKTSWQPAKKIINGISMEAHIYALIPTFQKRLVAASVVKANDGWRDAGDRDVAANGHQVSTMRYIRANAQADIKEAAKLNKKIITPATLPLKEIYEPMAFMVVDHSTSPINQILFTTEPDKLTDRVQTRIVLNVWGWTLVYFTSLQELLTVIAGAIKDHKDMLESNVLHRDFSHGNILIQPKPYNGETQVNVRDLVSNTTGVLIDLDHAKAVGNKKLVGLAQKIKTTAQRNEISIMEGQKDLLISGYDVTEEVVTLAMKFSSHAGDLLSYVRVAKEFNVLESKPNGNYSANDLGWSNVGPQPDFDSHRPEVAKRTGTIPFISHRLMKDKPETHNAIHDMESLFWVVIYICLTRQSGGGHRWKDSSQENRNLVTGLFETGETVIGSKKARYFEEDSDIDFKNLLTQTHQYFNPLHDMLIRWRKVLLLAYEFKAYEYYLVHDYLHKIIADTLNTPAIQKENVRTPAIRKELERREEEYRYITNIPPTALASSTATNQPSAAAQSTSSRPSAVTNHPPALVSATPSSSRLPASILPSAVPTRPPFPTPVASTSTSSRAPNPTVASLPRETPTSPKMPVPKKSRKD